MRFDFSYLLKSLGWFAYDGSNIDYCLAFLIGIVIGAVISSFRRKP